MHGARNCIAALDASKITKYSALGLNYLFNISTLQMLFDFIISEMEIKIPDGDMTPCSTAATTPTNTTATNDSWSHITSSDAVPWAGETFMIRDKIHGRVITLEDSKLRLKAYISKIGGWHWVCVEKDGWLGFRNPVSGTYIGRNGKGRFHAKVNHHKDHEFFCARRHPGGGYLLLMRRESKLWKMAIAEDGDELIETENEGTVWEFVKV